MPWAHRIHYVLMNRKGVLHRRLSVFLGDLEVRVLLEPFHAEMKILTQPIGLQGEEGGEMRPVIPNDDERQSLLLTQRQLGIAFRRSVDCVIHEPLPELMAFLLMRLGSVGAGQTVKQAPG